MSFMLGGFAQGLFGGAKDVFGMYDMYQHGKYREQVARSLKLTNDLRDKAQAGVADQEAANKKRTSEALPTRGPGSQPSTSEPKGDMPQPKFLAAAAVAAAPTTAQKLLPNRDPLQKSASVPQATDQDPFQKFAGQGAPQATAAAPDTSAIPPSEMPPSVIGPPRGPRANAPIMALPQARPTQGMLGTPSGPTASPLGPVTDWRNQPAAPIMPAPQVLPTQGMPGTPSGPTAWQPLSSGNPMRNQQSAIPTRAPTSMAIQQLKSRQLTPQDFDAIYGPGAAAHVLNPPPAANAPMHYLPPSQNPAFGPGNTGQGTATPMTQNQPLGSAILAAMNPLQSGG